MVVCDIVLHSKRLEIVKKWNQNIDEVNNGMHVTTSTAFIRDYTVGNIFNA
jgi:hypothetical protein